MNIIETDRLILRLWRSEDADAYFAINQDPKVIEFLPGPLTMLEVESFIAAMNAQYKQRHYTLWAAEEKTTGQLIGFIGLSWMDLKPALEPTVEIGWRLGSAFWGKGYATEGAKAALQWGFNECKLDEITAIAVPENRRSLRVMEKLGMQHDENSNFAHPRLPSDHRLSHHVFYRIKKLLS